jgi:hypothetical protein
MAVLSLVKHVSRDTNELLAHLAVLAEHEGGSVMLTYRSPEGWERFALTGIYKADPSKALKAAMQISIALTKEEELVRGKP